MTVTERKLVAYINSNATSRDLKGKITLYLYIVTFLAVDKSIWIINRILYGGDPTLSKVIKPIMVMFKVSIYLVLLLIYLLLSCQHLGLFRKLLACFLPHPSLSCDRIMLSQYFCHFKDSALTV